MSEESIYNVTIVTKGGEVYSTPMTFDDTYEPTRWLEDRRMHEGGVTFVSEDGDVRFFSFDAILNLIMAREG